MPKQLVLGIEWPAQLYDIRNVLARIEYKVEGSTRRLSGVVGKGDPEIVQLQEQVTTLKQLLEELAQLQPKRYV